MSTFIKTALAALALATVAVCSGPQVRAQECAKVSGVVAEAGEKYPDMTATIYKGDEAKRIVATAAAQSGREIDADEVTVLLSEEAGGGVILLSKEGCVKIAGRGPISVIKAILDAAKVGGST